MNRRGGTDSSPALPTKTVACRFARVWVQIYTLAVTRDVRDRRRAEIDSDVWEHVSDARTRRRSELVGQFEVLRRVLTGIPADLSWVVDMRGTYKESKSMTERRLQTIVIACALVIVTNFIVSNVIIDDFSKLSSVWWVLAVPIGLLLVGAVGIIAAVLLIKERRASRPA
jgi:hypothetical protein